MTNRLTRLQLTNWRNFGKVDVPLAARVFLLGPNASGKSNLLDAVRFAQELALDGRGLTNAVNGTNRGGLRALRALSARFNTDVCLTLEALIEEERWTYHLKLNTSGTSKKPGPAIVVAERVTRGEQTLLERPSAEDKADPELALATALEQRSANAAFRPLRDFLQSIEYIQVVPQLVRARNAGDASRFGKGLGTGLIEAMGEVPKKTRDARLKRVQRALASILPQFQTLEWFQDTAGVPHLRAKYEHWRPNGGWQQESAFSDGTLRLIGLLWYLDQPGGPLLLEEPEMSLHPAAVRQLPRMLATVAARGKRQVIVTSHSPDLFADTGIEPSEVLVLQVGNEGSTVTVGSGFDVLRRAAEDDLPLSSYLEALTRPEKSAELGGFGVKS